METKANLDKARFIIDKFNIPYFIEISPNGLARHLWVIWRNSSDFIIEMLSTMIHLYIV